jgi:hypothetical protein
MRQSRIDYGRLVEGALRGVVRDVLTRVSREGTPPPHHFFITFRTQHPGVSMPDFLRDRYPADMTVVLQHQFWDLDVDDVGFGVTLSFSDQPHRLQIPFEAIKVFADPGVEFGLQFTLDDEGDGSKVTAEVTPLRAAGGPHEVVPVAEGEKANLSGQDGAAAGEGGAEIVPLDRFRRK